MDYEKLLSQAKQYDQQKKTTTSVNYNKLLAQAKEYDQKKSGSTSATTNTTATTPKTTTTAKNTTPAYQTASASKNREEKRDATWKKQNYVDYDFGTYGKGNIDLTATPRYKNADGTTSTVDSTSFNIDGQEVLLPSVWYDESGNAYKASSDKEILDHYNKTGQYLGKFATVEDANAYANALHNQQQDALTNEESDLTWWQRLVKSIGEGNRAAAESSAAMYTDDYLSPAEATAVGFAKGVGATSASALIGSGIGAITGNEEIKQSNADIYNWMDQTAQQAQEEQKTAYNIGNIIGDVSLMTAIGSGTGKLAGKALTSTVKAGTGIAAKGAAAKATNTLANKAIVAAVRAATTATTFATKTAVQEAGGVSVGATSIKDYAKEVATSGASGAAFGIVDAALSAGGTELLRSLNSKKSFGIDWTSPFAWFTKEVASGMAGAGASIATDIALASPDEDFVKKYKAIYPNATDEQIKSAYKAEVKKNAGKQMLMMFFFTMISAGTSTANEVAKTKAGMSAVEQYVQGNFDDAYMAKAEKYREMSVEERVAFAKETIARVNKSESQLETLFGGKDYYGVGMNAEGKRIYAALENIKSIAETDLRPFSGTEITPVSNTQYASEIMSMVAQPTSASTVNATANAAAKASAPVAPTTQYIMPTATQPGRFVTANQQQSIENIANAVYNNNNTIKEADNGRGDLSLSGGSQRVQGQGSVEQTGLVEGQAGRIASEGRIAGANEATYFGSNGKAEGYHGTEEIKVDAANAKDKSVGGITISRVVDASEITPKLKSGTKLGIVEGEDTPSMAKARKRANEAGAEIIFVAGANLVSADTGVEARGCLVSVNKKGIKIVCRVDDKYADSDQITRHEIGHDLINGGKLNPRKVVEDFRRKYHLGEDTANMIVDTLMKARGIESDKNDEYTDYAITELICDALGDIAGTEEMSTNKIWDTAIRNLGDFARIQLGTEDRNTVAPDGAVPTRKNVPTTQSGTSPPTMNTSFVNPDFVEMNLSVAPPYNYNSKSEIEWRNSLDPKARRIYDIFAGIHEIGIRFPVSINGGKPTDITRQFMLASSWNKNVKENAQFANVAKQLVSSLPENIRSEARMNTDGTINPTPFETEFKMQRSFPQRIVDALPMEVVSPDIKIGNKTYEVSDKEKIKGIGGEELREALIDERRKMYDKGTLKTKVISGLSTDSWGTLGFLAENGKAGASGDFTTLCPQMYFNKGCFYCYRRAALTSGVNNKLVGQTIWYTGEILQLSKTDIDRLNANGGLRIQSFGDWMEQYSKMLADMLYDAEKVGLQIKIITKEPSMIAVVAKLKDQGLGKNLYFNLSADYTIERAGTNDANSIAMNPDRPFMLREGEMWWKRAMTVEEANEFRKKYPWVNTRIVATTQEEFLRGLRDNRVDVVTGYHGNIRRYERIDSETGETKVEIEPLGDNGMPVFSFDANTKKWSIESEGKTKTHKALAHAIEDAGLQLEYYTKTCCITGRCATCNGKCGKIARDFNVKNATNRDAESVAYWQKHMSSAVDNSLIKDMEEVDVNFSSSVTDGHRALTEKEIKNREKNLAALMTGEPLTTLKGSPIKRYHNEVGKEVGGQIYVHADYAEDVVPSEKLNEAADILYANYPDFSYNTVMYDKNKNTVRFDEAPDFDTAREPVPGNYATVDLDTGETKQGYSDYIWHHKWMWVRNDYSGFDVNESWEWSRRWLNVLRDTGEKVANRGVANGSGHGTENWNKQLEYFGLPLDKQGAKPVEQKHTSAGTSINANKVPTLYTAAHKKGYFKEGTVNIDIGAGRYDTATDYLKNLGVMNMPFDPFNRKRSVNKDVVDFLKSGKKADTATCSNCLNVIDSEAARANVILEMAKSIKSEGVALFTVYENKTNLEAGKAGEVSNKPDQWQEFRNVKTYVPEIQKYFDDVPEPKGGLIVARKPKANLPKALWQVSSKYSSVEDGVDDEAVLYSLVSSMTDEEFEEATKYVKENEKKLLEIIRANAAASGNEVAKDVVGENTVDDRWTSSRISGSDNVQPKSITEIIAKMEHDFGFNITAGHIRGQGVRGQFNPNDKGIRTKIINNLPTASHELGHALDNRYGILSKMNDTQKQDVTDKLSAATKASYKPQLWVSEGIAEFLRKYLQNRETAAIDYPEFTEFFLQTISPKDRILIEQLADDVNAYYSLGADSAGSIRMREDATPDYRTTGEKIKDVSDFFYQAWIDSNHALKMAETAMGGSGRAYLLATNSAYSSNIAGNIITGDLTDANGNYVGSGLKAALNGVNIANKKEYLDFNEYLVCLHGTERLARGMRVFADDHKNSTQWMNNRASVLERQYPKFHDAALRLIDFEKRFTETWGVGYGLVAKDVFDHWNEIYQYHVPFYRAMEKGRGGAKRGYANQTSPYKRAKGSGRDIIAPVDNIIDEIVRVVNTAVRNNVMLELRKCARTNGDATFMEKIPTPMVPKTFHTESIKNQLKDAVEGSRIDASSTATVDAIISGLDDVVMQFERGKPSGDVITILVKGKPEYWKINDPLLLESVANMAPAKLNGFMELYGAITRFMTSHITGNDVIWSAFSNLPRDLGTMTMYTKDKKDLMKVFKNLGSAYLNSLRQYRDKAVDPLFAEYLAMGGGHASMYSADRDLAKKARQQLTDSSVQNKLRYINPVNMISFFSDTIEMGPRFATYKVLREAGMDAQEAFYEAMDITTNFRKAGANSRELNKLFPFFNASVQGIDKFGRFYTGADQQSKGNDTRKKAVKSRWASLLAASVAIGALEIAVNQIGDDEKKDYKQLSNYTKNNFFLIPLGDGKYFAIPKPRELAVLTSAIQAGYDYIANDNDRSFDEFYAYAADQLLPSVVSDFVQLPANIAKDGMSEGIRNTVADMIGDAGIVGVIANVSSNRDFLGRPIESTYDRYHEPKDRYSDTTSAAAYWLGQAFNLSPKMIDYVGNQVLGYLWKYQKSLIPVNSEQRDLTLGVKSRYVKDNEYSTDLVNWLYDHASKTSTASKSDSGNMDKTISAALDTRMTTFYSNFNKLNKNGSTADKREARQLVLDMISEYQTAVDDNYLPNGLNEICKVVKSSKDTGLLPSIMNTSVKNSKGTEYSLNDKQYYEYQTYYLNQYYSYAESNLPFAKNDTEKVAILNSARVLAKEKATDYMLKKVGSGTTGYADKYAGVSDNDIVKFNAKIDVADDDGSLKQEEVTEIIMSMVEKGLSFDDAYTLFHSKYSSDKNNPWA